VDDNQQAEKKPAMMLVIDTGDRDSLLVACMRVTDGNLLSECCIDEILILLFFALEFILHLSTRALRKHLTDEREIRTVLSERLQE
jgi:hypothetical protein